MQTGGADGILERATKLSKEAFGVLDAIKSFEAAKSDLDRLIAAHNEIASVRND